MSAKIREIITVAEGARTDLLHFFIQTITKDLNAYGTTITGTD